MSSAIITDAGRVRGVDNTLQSMLDERRKKVADVDNWIDGATKKTEEDIKKLTMANDLK